MVSQFRRWRADFLFLFRFAIELSAVGFGACWIGWQKRQIFVSTLIVVIIMVVGSGTSRRQAPLRTLARTHALIRNDRCVCETEHGSEWLGSWAPVWQPSDARNKPTADDDESAANGISKITLSRCCWKEPQLANIVWKLIKFVVRRQSSVERQI